VLRPPSRGRDRANLRGTPTPADRMRGAFLCLSPLVPFCPAITMPLAGRVRAIVRQARVMHGDAHCDPIRGVSRREDGQLTFVLNFRNRAFKRIGERIDARQANLSITQHRSGGMQARVVPHRRISRHRHAILVDWHRPSWSQCRSASGREARKRVHWRNVLEQLSSPVSVQIGAITESCV
jgi:hypothetical protein